MYTGVLSHTQFFPVFIWGLLHTYHWRERERKKKKKAKKRRKKSLSHKEMHVYRRSFTQFFQIFTRGLLHTHTLHSTNSFYTRKCMYTLLFHTVLPHFHARASYHSRNAFHTRKWMYKGVFFTQFSIFIRWLLHIYALWGLFVGLTEGKKLLSKLLGLKFKVCFVRTRSYSSKGNCVFACRLTYSHVEQHQAKFACPFFR